MAGAFFIVLLRVILNELHVLRTFLDVVIQLRFWQIVDSLTLVLLR
jgi:hypothetical protein